MKLFLLWALLLLPVGPAAAQEIKMSQTAPLEQVYGETVEDDALLPMNELDMDFGYALYETTVDVEEENPTLTIENVRDYAAVYADGKLQGYLKDSSKSLKTNIDQHIPNCIPKTCAKGFLRRYNTLEVERAGLNTKETENE